MKSVLTLVLIAIAAQAQNSTPSPDPLADATRSWIQLEAKNLIAAAEIMPADKYGFQPTPQQMTFGHLMTHIVESNRYMCSSLAGEPLPKSSNVTDADRKDVILADVKASFDYCIRVLAKTDDSRLGEDVPLFKRTRADLMMFLTADHADHYATAAMYLRLNGFVPPTARPKG
jgi:uncharacterized damage-inducible protein DinB